MKRKFAKTALVQKKLKIKKILFLNWEMWNFTFDSLDRVESCDECLPEVIFGDVQGQIADPNGIFPLGIRGSTFLSTRMIQLKLDRLKIKI